MDNYNLTELLSYQIANTNLDNYENELLTLVSIRSSEESALIRRMSSAWISALNKKMSSKIVCPEAMIERSNRLREEGNVVFKTEGGNDRNANILDAGRLYTQAIFAAPECTEALALAHANRAMMLQEFGYYQQAYDDCMCALETNQYPKRLLHKIKTRQAYCSLYLKNATRLEVHLAELEKNKLNPSFMECMEQLRKGLSNLKLNTEKLSVENTITFIEESMKSKTQIVTSNDEIRGRYMIAKSQIKCGELIFSERISSFVPVGFSGMCQQCGVTLLIPFPCHACHGQVVYCSLQCRQSHVSVHQYECIAYRWQLFEQIGIAHLALRVVLEELPSVIKYLKEQNDAASIWLELTSSKGVVQKIEKHTYPQTLQMVTHLQHMTLKDIIWFAMMADFLVVYLKEYTHFFDAMNNTKANRNDWELITGALILKHIGQFIVNAHCIRSLSPVCFNTKQMEDCGFLLVHEFWSKPFRIHCGSLHRFADYRETCAANLPYLSICNHSCIPSIRPKFSGRLFYALADKDLQIHEEIFNCYTLNYKKSLKKIRHTYLEETYHFDCKCVKCVDSEEDEEYRKYHRYKCRNPKCQTAFVPACSEEQPFNWWQGVDENNPPEQLIRCPQCGEEQGADWIKKFKQLLQHVSDANKRAALFHLYKAMDKFLLDFHNLKLSMALEIVGACFEMQNGISILTDDECEFLINLLKFCLCATADQCGSNSIEYVVTMTYIWDLIAMKKYQCSYTEMEIMMKALDVVSEEYKTVFLNYYVDYICDLLV